MTTADLVRAESDDVCGKSGLSEAVEQCHISSVAAASAPLSVTLANADRAKTATAAAFDIRQLASAISCAKSKSEIEKIVREYSWKPSKVSCASEAGGTSDGHGAGGGSGGDASESSSLRQSVPETGRSTPFDSSGSALTASTKSYSWSSSLPNGSTLETLASNGRQRESGSTSSSAAEAGAGSIADGDDAPAEVTVAPTNTVDVDQSRKSSSVSENIDTTSQGVPSSSAAAKGLGVFSVTSGGGGDISNQTTVHDAGAGAGEGDTTQQVAASPRRRSSRSLRVGDFLPSRADVSERTFGSPRVSLIARLSRPRHYDESALDHSQFDRSVTVSMSSQLAATGRLMSTPATSTSSGSRVHSSQSGSNPSATGRAGSSCPVSDRARGSSSQLISSRRFDSTITGMTSMADNTVGLSMGPLGDTMLTASSLSMLPISSGNTTSALYNAGVDRDVRISRDAVGFSGRIPGFARPRSPAGQTTNVLAMRTSRTLASGTSICLS